MGAVALTGVWRGCICGSQLGDRDSRNGCTTVPKTHWELQG